MSPARAFRRVPARRARACLLALLWMLPAAGASGDATVRVPATVPEARAAVPPEAVGPPPADADARAIIAFAAARSGGDAWLHAETNVMEGEATLCRGAEPARCVHADRYVMYRVYPRELHAAHAGTGRFRLDAESRGRALFRLSFDGRRSYDQDGPVPPERAASEEANAFGFSAIRFADQPGFGTERLTDDDVEGHPCFVVRVTDPSGSATLFAIDRADGSIRLAAWQSPQGWHQRLYSDFYWVDEPGFRQPGRVRLYYDGLKTVDIRWHRASIDVPLPDELFVLP